MFSVVDDVHKEKNANAAMEFKRKKLQIGDIVDVAPLPIPEHEQYT